MSAVSMTQNLVEISKGNGVHIKLKRRACQDTIQRPQGLRGGSFTHRPLGHKIVFPWQYLECVHKSPRHWI